MIMHQDLKLDNGKSFVSYFSGFMLLLKVIIRGASLHATLKLCPPQNLLGAVRSAFNNISER